MTRPSHLLVAALSLSSAGCYTTWDIGPRELAKLDGYRAPEARMVVAKDGDQVQVDQGTALIFHGIGSDQRVEAQFDAIDVKQGPEGLWLAGLRRGDEWPIVIPDLSQSKVQAKRYSHGKTAGLCIGVTLGAAATAVAIAIPVLFANANWGIGFGGGGDDRHAPHPGGRSR